jgi:hypothetical protein
MLSIFAAVMSRIGSWMNASHIDPYVGWKVRAR